MAKAKKTLTPTQYVKAMRAEGKFPHMPIDGLDGCFWLCDADWSPLKGQRFSSKEGAMNWRSKCLARFW